MFQHQRAAYRLYLALIGSLCWLLVGCGGIAQQSPPASSAPPAPPASPGVEEATPLPPTPTPLPPTPTPLPPTPTPLPPTPTPDPAVVAAREAVDTYFSQMTERGAFRGSVLIVRDGTLLLSKGYGYANWEQRTPNTPQTRHRLASITKQFTAVGILMLYEQGKIDLHASLCTYLLACPPAWQPITIHHLLNHTSGIPDYTAFEDFEQTEMMSTTPDELIDRFINVPPLFPPGQQYLYSNSGYVLLGRIIENVSGLSYGDFIQQNIFEPLHMTSSGYDTNIGEIQGQSTGYLTGTRKARFLNVSTLYAAGALYSTVEDLYRWDQALYTEKLLSRATIALMYTPTDTGEGYGSGYGWKITSIDGHQLYFHTGTFNGFRNYIGRYPNERLTIIILCNLEALNHKATGEQVARLIFQAWP